jgi:hypothetical protein
MNMKASKIALASWMACALGVAQAATQDVGSFTIEMPDQFQGPQIQRPMPNTTVQGYSVESAAVPKAVVMIVVRENDDKSVREPTPEEAPPILKKLAGDMVAGTARRRTDFQASEPRDTKIAGLPAVEVEWTGKLNDTATSGRLFVVISGSAAYFFHVMGAEPPTKDMLAAIEAVKGLQKRP